MISVRDFLYVNQKLCEKNHNCEKCPLYGENLCCVFRCKSLDDITKVVDTISITEKQFLKDAMDSFEENPPQILPVKKDPEEAIAKALKEIKNELHDMKRIIDKRRS